MFIRRTKTNNINLIHLNGTKFDENWEGYAYKDLELTEKVTKEELKDHFFNLGKFHLFYPTQENKNKGTYFSSSNFAMMLNGFSVCYLMGMMRIYSKEIEGKE